MNRRFYCYQSVIIVIFMLLLLEFAPAYSVIERVGNLEYVLPVGKVRWDVRYRNDSNDKSTVIYEAKNLDKQSSSDLLTIMINQESFDPNDSAALKNFLMKQYPSMDVYYTLLDRSGGGVMFEWWTKENESEKLHGWGRVFKTKEGTDVMLFETSRLKDVSDLRASWSSALQHARIWR